MPRAARYLVHATTRRGGAVASVEAYEAADEDAIYRRGVAMQPRVSGLAFFKIETSAEGDQWTEVTLLSATGESEAEAN